LKEQVAVIGVFTYIKYKASLAKADLPSGAIKYTASLADEEPRKGEIALCDFQNIAIVGLALEALEQVPYT
jgi:hypothetical protein